MGTLRLITIPISHYCEKARWALERAGLPYREERHLQLFHTCAVYRAGGGDTAPVLVTPETVLTDSTDILRWADEKAAGDRKLYPLDPKSRREVEDFANTLDEELGVAGRLWMYTFMLDELPLIVRYSRAHGVPWLELKLMPLLFPLLRSYVERSLDLTATSREDSRQLVQRTFDEIARQLGDGRRYLRADRFTAADLTFAALAASVLLPDGYGVALPRIDELPGPMREQVEAWRAHPAGQFALRLYREERTP